MLSLHVWFTCTSSPSVYQHDAPGQYLQISLIKLCVKFSLLCDLWCVFVPVASSGTVVAGVLLQACRCMRGIAGVLLHACCCGCVIACVLLHVGCRVVLACMLLHLHWHAWCSAFSSMSMICSLPYIQGYELHH